MYASLESASFVKLTTDLIGHDIQNPTAYDLEHGQAWEEELAKHIRAQGIRAYRPIQRIWPMREPQTEHDARFVRSYVDRKLLRPYQLDLVVRHGKQRWNIEVKALTGAAFRSRVIHFGKVDKWNAKTLPGEPPVTLSAVKAGAVPAVPVHLICLVDKHTGQAYLVPPDKRLWQVVPSFYGSDMDYAIAADMLTPLQHWLDNLKLTPS